ncbi:3-hydroxyacyl-CoA dehydrogenase type-2-like [Paramacrobiotus metropolitanus]|uniref:3-hydroxyacyl-CoA dehydrogenase type-2-like n=1 Tax=Paramacrobiotus metropolitanus TaxID=2943436 RepID=UPI002446224D|nr:3-hydroxyacyl-CoA dehydrogenase type-2-like [Paramacrobiotus metropolitanus]
MHTIGKDFVAIVTGGASGLGRGAAEFLAGKGATVFVLDLPDAISKWATDKDNICLRAADVTSEEQVTAVIDEIRSKHNRLDCVVTSAGIPVTGILTYDAKTNTPHPMEDFIRCYNVNVFGTFNVIRLSVALMRETQTRQNKEGPAVIITVSSRTMVDPPAEHVAYSSGKAAIAGMTVPLARELSEFGIRVVDIAPGPMLTPILFRDGAGVIARESMRSMMFPVRPGTPEEFADLVRFIIENPFINATTVFFDGGYRNPAGSTYRYSREE